MKTTEQIFFISLQHFYVQNSKLLHHCFMVYHSLKWTIFSYILTVLTSRFSICLIPTEPVFHCVLADCKLQLVIIWFVHKLKVFGVENSCRISFPSFNINPWCSEVTWNDTHVVSDLCKCLSWFEMNFHNVWKEGWTPEVTSWNFWNWVSRGCGGETQSDKVRRVFKATVIILTDRPASCESEPSAGLKTLQILYLILTDLNESQLFSKTHQLVFVKTSLNGHSSRQRRQTMTDRQWCCLFFFFLSSWYNPLITDHLGI